MSSEYTTWCAWANTSWNELAKTKFCKMSSEIEEHITKKYEIKKRLGKGVSVLEENCICMSQTIKIRRTGARFPVMSDTGQCLFIGMSCHLATSSCWWSSIFWAIYFSVVLEKYSVVLTVEPHLTDYLYIIFNMLPSQDNCCINSSAADKH